MSNHDPWNGLATLMTLLETVVDANKDYLVLERDEGVYGNINIYCFLHKFMIINYVSLILSVIELLIA